ncbi:hypothetical protein CCMSSC00406_0007945 [Pleurotus cornucopiae]|uniref:Uncharacterized protein n=1 Tax=Pleurotus cornucopiae TaxID=5321 RepID=A0ACB7IPQ3_PLECO|nr:hypothetical protein CCMSSC00406_0007945 [Pleurotus cornucopiae]
MAVLAQHICYEQATTSDHQKRKKRKVVDQRDDLAAVGGNEEDGPDGAEVTVNTLTVAADADRDDTFDNTPTSTSSAPAGPQPFPGPRPRVTLHYGTNEKIPLEKVFDVARWDTESKLGGKLNMFAAFSERNLEDELKAYELDSFCETVDNIDSD